MISGKWYENRTFCVDIFTFLKKKYIIFVLFFCSYGMQDDKNNNGFKYKSSLKIITFVILFININI